MDADEQPITPDTQAVTADGAEDRLNRIAGRMIGLLASDPEWQDGDAAFVLLDRRADDEDAEDTAAGAYGGHEDAADALAALAGHTQAIAEEAGFRLLVMPVAGE